MFVVSHVQAPLEYPTNVTYHVLLSDIVVKTVGMANPGFDVNPGNCELL